MEVTGSKVTLNNQPALIAREVKVNGTTLKLRDDQGLPVWRGMGQGSGGGQGRVPAGAGKGPAGQLRQLRTERPNPGPSFPRAAIFTLSR